MRSLKVATRLNLLIALLSGLLVLMGGLGLYGIRQSNQALEDVYQERTLPIAQIAEIQQKTLRNRLNIAMAIANPTPDAIASEIAKTEANIAAISKVWATYTAHSQSPAVAALVERFGVVRKPFVEEGLKPALAALRVGDMPEATRLAVDKVRPLYQPLDETIQALTALYLEESAKEYAAALAHYAQIQAISIVAVLGGVFFGVLLGSLIVRSIVRELGAEPGDAAEVARSVAAGNLTTDIRTLPGDSSSLMVQLHHMQASLVAVVGQVRSNSEGVASASEQIAQGNNDLAHRTEMQASTLQQTAASMAELSRNVQHNTDNAQQANQLAQSAATVAIHGGKVVGQVVATMKGINDSSKQIADIIGVIDGIAFQTNILALNAAVEAARAGEQGRGFAVVASEVRSLAGRSADAAKEIAGLISASVERVAQGTVLVDQAGQTMQEVVASIQRVTEIMQTINTASQKQSLGMLEVGAAVNQIDETTQQNAALVEESAAAADSLKIQAQQLVDVVAVFQLGTAAPVRRSPQAVRPVGSRQPTARVGQVATAKRLTA